MTNAQKIAKQSGRKRGANRAGLGYLDKLIDEATVGCSNESGEMSFP